MVLFFQIFEIMSTQKILFLVGSLEQSKCGVSDYVHLLVERLSKDGHICLCVAINDRYISRKSFTACCVNESAGYSFYRYSSSLSWRFRLKQLKKIINDFKPNITSLQYVPYSFDDKGLPYHLFLTVMQLVDHTKWHIMAHELWTMPDKGLIKRLVSLFQKLITINLLKLLRPQVVHVSNFYYRDMLLACGISSTVLPLFSHIPVTQILNLKKDDNVWNFVFFGTLSPSWRYSEFFRRVNLARSKYGIELCRFCLLGNCGEFADALWLKFKQEKIPFCFEFIRYGYLHESQISRFLQLANFGVTTMPDHLVDKSSGVAAMVAHNLPIIITNISQKLSKSCHIENNAHHYIQMDELFEERLSIQNLYNSNVDQLRETSKQFIFDISV
ncbi:hypothetical protein SynA1562_01788 [Synechococcus sp. A15-62]|uniref:hypothetical protein n=1 Tax=Synechococcus sp. A15-62 TaxID=1050657 RepID=UPI001645A134|nr:hypothetical protein [Synechococcus sp. A15-62]QNJ00618.1 hypothetical protein SynA1562_01788 [Synechococcus sp. A15-62]